MEQETFVVAIEDLVDASEREAAGAPVVAEAWSMHVEEAWVQQAEAVIWGA